MEHSSAAPLIRDREPPREPPRAPNFPLRASACGVLLALFALTGRWSIDRVLGTDLGLAGQPRTWILLILVIVAGLRLQAPLFTGPTCWLAAFLLWATGTLAWAPSLETGAEKSAEALAILVSVVTIKSAISRRDTRPLVAGFWLGVLLVAGGLLSLAVVGGSMQGRLAVLGGGPNVFARNMGLLAIAALQVKPRRRSFDIGLMVVAGGAVCLTVLSGSRGGILALACALFCLGPRLLRASRAVQLLVALALIGTLAVYTDLHLAVSDTVHQRIVRLTLDERHTSGREALYYEAWDLFKDAPISGNGIGAFAILGSANYPHNLLLEIACETGLIGFGLFTAGLTHLAVRLWSGRNSPNEQSYLFSALTLFLIAAQFSGDLFDSRAVFFLAALLDRQLAVPPGT